MKNSGKLKFNNQIYNTDINDLTCLEQLGCAYVPVGMSSKCFIIKQKDYCC